MRFMLTMFFQRTGVEAHRQPKANEYFVFRSGSKSVLAFHDAVEKVYRRVEKAKSYGITPRNAEQTFALHALSNNNIKLVTLTGKAGTGKTLLALAAALACRSDYRQIYLARPVVPLSNRDLGFLPGDVEAKLTPYMQPLYDNLTVIRHQFNETDADAQRIPKLLETEKLVITPLAYIRGRSLQRVFFIVDEAQNLTPHEVKTIITRAGEGTKVIFTGDIHQIDHPFLDSLSNGLSYLISRMVGQPVYSHITLENVASDRCWPIWRANCCSDCRFGTWRCASRKAAAAVFSLVIVIREQSRVITRCCRYQGRNADAQRQCGGAAPCVDATRPVTGSGPSRDSGRGP